MTKLLLKSRWVAYINELQNQICQGVEEQDGQARFEEDKWQRKGGGGGKTRVISNGHVFEKGGVNTSVVFGEVSEAMEQQLNVEGHRWFAGGLSLILHPINPFVPTVHANWRYFELYNKENELIDQWFGGGADLTPYYLFDEDAQHFHRHLKSAMDAFDTDFYFKYKRQCDHYFNNHHRGVEARGIGGVFYDYLRPTEGLNAEQLFQFQKANGNGFIPAYFPIVKKRKDYSWTAQNKYWQEIRRGRYVEFNLLHDRGTLFGLKTHGRIDSILMSLPPTVRFDYHFYPEKDSEEEKLLKVCQNPRDWV